MAADKKSFLIYTDVVHTLEHMDDQQAGKLFRLILDYVNDKNPVTTDPILKIAFEPIKQQLKRDLRKWEQYVDKQKVNGTKGGRPKTQKTQAFFSKPKKPVSVSVNVNDSVGVRESVPTPDMDGLYVDAQAELLNRPTLFESCCIKADKTREVATRSLEKYHLYLIERNLYPMSIRSIQAGFTKWLMNEFTPKDKKEYSQPVNHPTYKKLQ